MPVSAASTSPPQMPLPVSSGSSTSRGIITNQSAPKTTSSAAKSRRKSRLPVTTENAVATYGHVTARSRSRSRATGGGRSPGRLGLLLGRLGALGHLEHLELVGVTAQRTRGLRLRFLVGVLGVGLHSGLRRRAALGEALLAAL